MAPPPPPPPRSGAPTATDFRDLTSAISTLSTEMARSRGGRTTTRTSTSGRSSMADSLNKFLRDFDTSVNKLSRSLQKVVSSLQQTQQDFGVNIGAAAQLQINAFKESIESYIASVKSLDFSGLGEASAQYGSDLFGSLKELTLDDFLTGNMKGVVDGITTATSKYYGTLTAERPGKEAPIQGFDSKLFLQTQKSLQDEFGTINAKVAEDITRTATTQGLNVDQLVKARRIFSTQSRGDMDAAGKAQNKFFTEFEKKGLSGKVALKSIGENAELLARNGARFAGSFARAAADAVKIGVNLSKISQVGDNIISDFEGFLESQAELGAMGFGFDSSRLAEVAETGDDAALFNELRSQLAATGKDITKLRRSERLALESAFGISISDMLKLSGETPDGEKGTEELLGDSNSLLTNILTALAPLAKLTPVLTTLITGLGTLLMGLFSALGTTIGLMLAAGSPLGNLLSKGLLAAGVGLATLFVTKYGLNLIQDGRKLVAEGKTGEGVLTGAAGGAAIGAGTMAALIAGLALTGTGVGAMGGIPMIMAALGLGAGVGAATGASISYQQGKQDIYGPTVEANKKRQEEQDAAKRKEMEARGYKTFTDPFTSTPRIRTDFLGRPIEQPKSILDPTNPNSPYYQPPVKKASGGPIQGPGTSTSDSIPARLSDGEYVVNAKSASVAGNGLLNLINNTKDKRQLLTALLRSISMTPESQFLFDEQKTTNKMTDKYGNVIMRAEGGPVEKPGTTTPKPGLFDRIKNFAKTGTTSVPSVATPTVEQTEEQVNKLDTNSFNKIIEGFNKLAKFGEKLNTTADKITDPDGGLNKVATAGEKKGFMSKLGELTKVLGKQPDGTDGEPKDFMSKLNTITGIFSKKSEQTESSTEGEKKGFISKLSGLADMFSKKPEGTEGESNGFMSKISGLTSLFTKKPEGTEGESKGFMSKISGLTSMFSKKPGETPDTGEKKGFMSKMGDIAGILGVGKAPGEGGESKTAMSKFSEITGLFAKKQTGPDDKKGFMGTVSGIASIFGKKESEGGGTFAQKALSSAQSIKGVGKFLGKVPGFGGVASAIAGGEGIKGAITSTASAGVGKWVGGLLGSAIPVPGVGTLLGSLAGDWAGKKLGGLMSSAGSGIKKLFTKGKDGKSMAGKIAGYTPAGLAVKGLNKFADSKIGKFTGVGLAKKALTSNVGKSIMKYSPAGLVAGGIGKLGKMFKPKPQVTPENVETMTSPDLSMMIGSQRYTQPEPAPQQAPTVDTRGIEQKLNNFINALQGIQINMDGAQVGKVLVNTSDAAMTTGVFRLQSR
jgi:hypothetical protein